MKTTGQHSKPRAFVLVFFQALITTVLPCVLPQACWASHQVPEPVYKDTHQLIDRINSNFCASSPLGAKIRSYICFGIAANGKVCDLKIVDFSPYSDDSQFNAEFLEALYCSEPLPRSRNTLAEVVQPCEFRFDPSLMKPAHDGSDIRKYLQDHPQSTPPYTSGYPHVLVHRIPLSLLTLRPGLFTENELINVNNLTPCDIGVMSSQPSYVREIQNLHAKWECFLGQHPAATKQEILDFAKSVDKVAE